MYVVTMLLSSSLRDQLQGKSLESSCVLDHKQVSTPRPDPGRAESTCGAKRVQRAFSSRGSGATAAGTCERIEIPSRITTSIIKIILDQEEPALVSNRFQF